MYNVSLHEISPEPFRRCYDVMHPWDEHRDYITEEDLNDRGSPITVSRQSDRSARRFRFYVWLQQEAKTALTDEALKQTYDEAVKSMSGQEEVRARHILVEGEDEAKAILEQLKAGVAGGKALRGDP